MVRQFKNPYSNFRKLLQGRIEETNPRRELTTEESKRLSKLEVIADKLKRRENVQNRQLETWISKDEYAQLEAEWQQQGLNPPLVVLEQVSAYKTEMDSIAQFIEQEFHPFL